MAKITEQDIVEFLEDKIEQLKKELRKTQIALETLKGIHEIDEVKLKKKERKIIKSTIAQADKKEKTSRKSAGKSTAKAKKTAPIQVSLEDKINTALTQGAAFREDIVKKILEQELNADAKKVDKAVANKLSALLKDKKIHAVKEGAKYKYNK
ncbi:hypothetical protein SAMN05216490_1556 [Mucilaginibacter mallensis]|uniref:Uncharacterized protein n=1 Tax=Mucilaginibacter mallensis TaxID=652787 RepID=A0A1H1TZS6_MUCMA|nr:hypothetical protein [Mucilaginibacter mallensis]SDS65614.1 hypothetical protein SAMN05216490_1556 [Mucilaginibacter mallensis]